MVIDGSVFKGVNKEKCVLYVPQDSYQDYWLAEGWGDFKNIVEYDATKVGNSVVDKEIKEVARYTANGQRLDTPTKGLNPNRSLEKVSCHFLMTAIRKTALYMLDS